MTDYGTEGGFPILTYWVGSLSSARALRKTFELVATTGPAQQDLDAVFAPLDADPQGSLDGVRDMANMPLQDEPEQVRAALDAMLAAGRPL